MLERDKSPLRRTPLHALHVARGGKMVPFAGYDMPVQYPAGVLKEHLHARNAAGRERFSRPVSLVLSSTCPPLEFLKLGHPAGA